MVALVGAVLCVLVAGTLFVVSPLGELSVSRLENPTATSAGDSS
jgi:hypothetical protein